MNKETEKQMNEIVKRISKIKSVAAIYLFGSQVTGRARLDSDVDIAVLTKNATENEETNISLSGNKLFEIHILAKLPPIIQYRIFKEGILLYVNDEKCLNEVKAKVIITYLDFLPFLNRFSWGVINNV